MENTVRKIPMKKIRFYDLRLNGKELDEDEKTQIVEMTISEDSIKHINRDLGTDYHIRNREDMEKVLRFYLESWGDLESLEYKCELI